jgi:hypothetical protein
VKGSTTVVFLFLASNILFAASFREVPVRAGESIAQALALGGCKTNQELVSNVMEANNIPASEEFNLSGNRKSIYLPNACAPVSTRLSTRPSKSKGLEIVNLVPAEKPEPAIPTPHVDVAQAAAPSAPPPSVQKSIRPPAPLKWSIESFGAGLLVAFLVFLGGKYSEQITAVKFTLKEWGIDFPFLLEDEAVFKCARCRATVKRREARRHVEKDHQGERLIIIEDTSQPALFAD